MKKTYLERAINFESKKLYCWIMRQAGRYLPEYRELYQNNGCKFFNLCENANLAHEITMQPIERFNFDAAIIFSDILVIPKYLGCNINFENKNNPTVTTIQSVEDIKNHPSDLMNLKHTIDAISLTRKKLDNEKSLIGFAGSPWTVAYYMIEGFGSSKFSKIKHFASKKRKEFEKILDIITDVTIMYLQEQIKAGVNLVQLFDSLSGCLSSEDFYSFVIKPTKKIVSSLNCKVIGFPKDAGTNYIDYAKLSGVDCVGFDYSVSPKWIKDNIEGIVAIQGNLDPYLLCYDIDNALKSTEYIIDILYGRSPFIFNLGHGILKDTPIDNVSRLLTKIRGYL
ncbi:uroporphyrinogen decarboxylase [Anaplasmataceae bacterium AB001_6]|nr:uroporphyrinogen decarboxylase [Anaplasmataceae bacterium AB001_6]